MRGWISNIFGLLARFSRAREGVAAVEFALILPMMLVLYVGSVEVSTLISSDRRVQLTAGTVGDLVARSDTTIPTATLTNYFRAAENIMLPGATSTLVQVVSLVQVKADGTNLVVWSRQYSGSTLSSAGKARVVNQPMTIPTNMTNVAKGAYLIVSEAYFTFQPITTMIFQATIPLYRQNFYIPRFGGKIDLV